MKIYFAVVLIALTLLFSTAVQAQDAGYELAGSVVAGGGGQVSGGAYAMSISIGQPGTYTLRGGDYALGGGIFGGGASPTSSLYLPLLRR
jgi:hypothetical protein